MPATQNVTDNTTDVLRVHRDDTGGVYVDIQFTPADTLNNNILTPAVPHVVRIPVQSILS